MFCPFKMANAELTSKYNPNTERYDEADWDCEKLGCQLWNERFGLYSLAVDAYLKGQEDWRREKDIMRHGG